MTSVAVIGGGPAGSACAALLARENDVTVFEEHPAIGEPVQCAGLITDQTIKLSGVDPGILSTLYGADVILPNGRRLTARSRNPKARTVDRREFDSLLADRAVDAGAEYRTSDRVRSFDVTRDSVQFEHAGGRSSCDLLIGADGSGSSVSSYIGDNDAPEYLRGIQAYVRGNTTLHDDLFTIRLGSRYSPGFFAWEIPCGDMTRVGLCVPESEGHPWPYLSRMLSDLNLESRVVGKSCGRIPIGWRRTMSSDRIMLIGDAASQVKPISGGGLYPAMAAAPILADTARRALDAGDLSARRLSRYDRAFRRDMGRTLERDLKIRTAYRRMDDAALNRAGDFAARPDAAKILKDLDMDEPSLTIGRMLHNPVLAAAGLYTLVRCLL